ncbi:MAG: AAA family ATPase, partial [Actinomycetes bacterium]
MTITGTSSTYLPRVIDGELDDLLTGLPAIAIDGAKGVGKTTTARQRARTIHQLDNPTTYSLIQGRLGRLTEGEEAILIDEHQRYAPSWDLVRRSVDDDNRPGRFILTGSASVAAPA